MIEVLREIVIVKDTMIGDIIIEQVLDTDVNIISTNNYIAEK